MMKLKKEISNQMKYYCFFLFLTGKAFYLLTVVATHTPQTFFLQEITTLKKKRKTEKDFQRFQKYFLFL